MKQAGANTISQAKETELAKRLVSDGTTSALSK